LKTNTLHLSAVSIVDKNDERLKRMLTDRITKITVKFEDATGSKVLARIYEMDPGSTTIKATQPQGKVPGNLELRGLVLKQEDKSGGTS
jgi:hypothetical protein